MRRIIAALTLLALTHAPGQPAGRPRHTYRPQDRPHLSAALAALNMTTNDLSFKKDVAEPRFALKRVRELLDDPLLVPLMADEILAAASAGTGPCWGLAHALLEAESRPRAPVPFGELVEGWEAVDLRIAEGLARFYEDAERATRLLNAAFETLKPEERVHMSAALLGGVFRLEDRPALRAPLRELGIDDATLDRILLDARRVDPGPATDRFLSVLERVSMANLLAAGRTLQEASDRLAQDLADTETWPAAPVRIPTSLGDIWVGSTGSDIYTNPALLIVDGGGDDLYTGQAGAANGLRDRTRLAAIVDCRGRDRYESDGLLAPGAALFGAAAVLDLAGDDTCQAAYAGQGAGLFGIGILEDRAGHDLYRCHALGQGAGYVGVGMLRDEAGRDTYEAGFYAQGFAGPRALGLLVDRAGNDRYAAGGQEPDYERFENRYVSLAQGFAIGRRPFAGGGVGALVDLAGNDSYVADVYGQGVAYWYAAGFLLDCAGNDTYQMFQYGQGTGIHLSAGMLADLGGDDFYTGHALLQGSAHDYAVGILFDHAGSDTYSAHEASQGRAMSNGLGLLLDSSGHDAYLARQPANCQGIGHDGHYREYGCLGLLLDLAGPDVYSCGARNGARALRPDYGIVYDVKDAK